MPLSCFSKNQSTHLIPITAITPSNYLQWLDRQPDSIKTPLTLSKFEAKSGKYFLFFQPDGALKEVILGMDHADDFWAFGSLSTCLPEGNYQIGTSFSNEILNMAYLAWGLGSYRFNRYKSFPASTARLALIDQVNTSELESLLKSIFWIRDLVNTPNQDLGPEQLANEAEKLAQEFNMEIKQVLKDKLKTDYPCIYAVGKGSDRSPRLIDLHWGNPSHPKVTLVGKGVCFDSGGYDLKPSDAMLLMKKDMAGAAHVLGLARLIMAAQLPIRLRVLIPTVENLVSGRSYLPGDVLNSRKGLTIEITNTDAEGRLILCDALFEACNEKPELLIDFATLTGAAKIALGGEMSAFFTNRKELAQALMEHSEKSHDPMWELPLYKSYCEYLKSHIADLCNAVLGGKGAGSITAALFLEKFIEPEIPWIHFDLSAYNWQSKPGRPEGAEARSLRAVFSYLKEKYASKS